MLAACLHARNEMGSFFFPLIANMLFVSTKLFLAGKGFCEILTAFVNSVEYYPKLPNLHMWNILFTHPKVSLILFSAHRGIWTDNICLALPKILTKFESAKFSICQP